MMEKIVNENEKSFIKFLLLFLVWIVGIIVLLFIVPSILIKDENIMNYYVPFVVVSSGLIVYFLFFKLVYNNKPKYIDGKYVWKDGRVYEGDWDKKHGANGKGKLVLSDGSYYEGKWVNGKFKEGKGKNVCSNGEIYEGEWANGIANGKGKLIMSDGSFYEGEFKDGKPHGKGKREANGTVLEGTRVDGSLEGKGKLIGHDGGIYEGEFKNGRPDGMGIIKMINGYYYEGELSNGKRTGRFKKQILNTGGVIEGDFRDNGNDGFDGIGKVTTSNGFVFEGIFQNGKLNGEGKMTTPEGVVLLGTFENGELKKGKQILQNGEYSEGNWVNGCLTGMAKYYFKDGSYYEGECGNTGWQGVGTYVTKKGDRYSTEFPYEIINVFQYWVSEKIREINKNLNYIPKTEKEKYEEKNIYLKILEKGTLLQQEIARLYLEEYEKDEILLDSVKRDNSIGNVLNFHKGLLKIHEGGRENFRKLTKKHHIKIGEKSSYYSYGQFFNRLDGMYGKEHDVNVLYIKIDEFLHSKNILNFVTKKEKKEKERVILIDDFSDKYNEYVQSCLDRREYEKKFWKHNFKLDKKGK